MLQVTLYSLAISIAINLLMLVIAYKKQTDKLTDISYAVTFAVLSLYPFTQSEKTGLNYLALVMILVWAIRLGGFLLYRVSKVGKDSRFDQMRKNFLKFFQFWFFQGLTVWLLMLPIFGLSASNPRVTVLSIAGLIVWLLGFATETIADYQKFSFSQNPKNKGTWIDEGLWRYSRHPNYFGEILVWLGLYLLIVSSLTKVDAFVSIISPVYITILLLFVSGIPILEKNADEKWNSDKKYRKYKKSTSLLIPMPKR